MQEDCVLSPFLFLLAMDIAMMRTMTRWHWYPVEEQIPVYWPWICRWHCVTDRNRSWSATCDHKPRTRSCYKILQQDRKLKKTVTECRTGWTHPAPARWRAFVAQWAQQSKKKKNWTKNPYYYYFKVDKDFSLQYKDFYDPMTLYLYRYWPKFSTRIFSKLLVLSFIRFFINCCKNPSFNSLFIFPSLHSNTALIMQIAISNMFIELAKYNGNDFSSSLWFSLLSS